MWADFLLFGGVSPGSLGLCQRELFQGVAWAECLSVPLTFGPVSPGYVCTGQELGEGVTEAGQPQHRHCARGEQGRPGQQESRGIPGGGHGKGLGEA